MLRELDATCYHAARGFLSLLLGELPDRDRVDGELVTVLGAKRRPYWTRNVWEKPLIIEFASVGEAAKTLRSLQRNWACLPSRLHRRSALIAENLPPLPSKPKSFPFVPPDVPMGAFTLLDGNTMLASPVCSSPFANGEFEFEEDREGPPSRAYRKLWEAFVLAGAAPAAGDRCVDAGASPGGWTWALAGLGADVLAIDRAELEPRIAALPNVRTMRHDAFTLKPRDIGAVDWLCSDVICYPPALLGWLSSWLEAGLARNYVCTVKMQGAGFDKETTDRLAAIPGSRVLHLWHNRHELTWINLERDRGPGLGASPGAPYNPPMGENRREAPRFSVMLYMERREPVEGPIHIYNLSASGFLVRGEVLAGQGGIFHATFRVHPASGETRVTARGKVMHSRIDGPNSEFGIRIDGFGSPEEESAYQAYVRELAEKAGRR